MKEPRGVRIDKKKDGSEIRIYFCPKMYDPDQDALKQTMNTLVFYSHASGCELNRHRFGEVRIYFNPLYHKKSDRKMATKKVLKAILASATAVKNFEADFVSENV